MPKTQMVDDPHALELIDTYSEDIRASLAAAHASGMVDPMSIIHFAEDGYVYFKVQERAVAAIHLDETTPQAARDVFLAPNPGSYWVMVVDQYYNAAFARFHCAVPSLGEA